MKDSRRRWLNPILAGCIATSLPVSSLGAKEPLRVLVPKSKVERALHSPLEDCFYPVLEEGIEIWSGNQIKIIYEDFRLYEERFKLGKYGLAQNQEEKLLLPDKGLEVEWVTSPDTPDLWNLDIHSIDVSRGNVKEKTWKTQILFHSCQDLRGGAEEIAKLALPQLLGKQSASGKTIDIRKNSELIYPPGYFQALDQYKNRNLKQARISFESLLQTHPDFFLIHAQLAKIYYYLGFQAHNNLDHRSTEYFRLTQSFVEKCVDRIPYSSETQKIQFIQNSIPGHFNPGARLRSSEKAIQLAPLDSESHYFHWMAKGGKPDDPSLKKALHLNPRDPYLLNDYGRVLRFQRNFDSSVQLFKESIRALPDYPEPYVNLISTYIDGKKFSAGQKLAEESEALFPDNPHILYSRGLAHYAQNQYDLAESSFQKAITTAPRHGHAHHYLGRIYSLSQNPKMAEFHKSQACQLGIRASCQ